MKKYLTYEKFVKKVKELDVPYWSNTYVDRWQYMWPVIELLKKINPDTAIEMGTAGISLMEFSDTIDIHKKFTQNKSYLMDARKTPWNIPDNYYDVFVGLQVLEHLRPNQFEVFKEIKRISKEAIISLPYKWVCNKNDCHYMIDENIINEWTDYERPVSKKIIKSRIELYYRF